MPDEPEPPALVLPVHCFGCGAYLMGGRTQHEPWCRWVKVIEEHFPGYGLEIMRPVSEKPQ
jgi:hypothetical protein